MIVLAATDPAQPYGAALAWPERDGRRPMRAAGSRVVLVDGALVAWLGRGEASLMTFIDDDDESAPARRDSLARALAGEVRAGTRRALLIEQVDGGPVGVSPLAGALREAGFVENARGFLRRA